MNFKLSTITNDVDKIKAIHCMLYTELKSTNLDQHWIHYELNDLDAFAQFSLANFDGINLSMLTIWPITIDNREQ